MTARQSAKALGAQHAVVMLGDALPAKEPMAIRASHHGFAASVMITSLIGKLIHIPYPDMAIATMNSFKRQRFRLLPPDTAIYCAL